MIIKNLDKNHIQEMVEIYLNAYEGLEEYSYNHPVDVEDYINWLFQRDSQGIIGAFKQSQLCGFICIDRYWYSKREGKTVGAIHELVVEKSHRRKGIATNLLKKAFEIFKESGIDLLELWAGVNNIPALSFYEKMGFIPKERYSKWVRMVFYLPQGQIEGELLKNTAP
ncbi:MAG: GNAT family N-acetyltransferase [Aquificaceae bacterium]